MRRFARQLLLLCTAASLLLCVVAGALWVRSMWKGDLVAWIGTRSITARSEQGLVRLYDWIADPDEQRGLRYGSWSHGPDFSNRGWQGRRWWDRMGFGHYIGGSRSGNRVDQFVFPHYAVVVLTGILPGFVAVRWFNARRRRSAGVCPKCGYDLRASPERCPECGTPRGH